VYMWSKGLLPLVRSVYRLSKGLLALAESFCLCVFILIESFFKL